MAPRDFAAELQSIQDVAAVKLSGQLSKPARAALRMVREGCSDILGHAAITQDSFVIQRDAAVSLLSDVTHITDKASMPDDVRDIVAQYATTIVDGTLYASASPK